MSTLSCDIKSISYFNHDTRQVILQLPEGISADFKAGQYLQVQLPSKMCPFSIASSPDLIDQIELHIRPTPNSQDSDEIEQLLDEANSLEIEFPLGDCAIDQVPDQPLLLIAASTGITQMKSMIEYLLARGLKQPVYLYWGVLSEADIYLKELCERWAQNEHFHFVPVVSEPDTSPGWQGKTGLVGQVALEDLKDVSNTLVYVGGSPNMVYATLDQYIAAGMPESNMFSDVFSYAPRTK